MTERDGEKRTVAPDGRPATEQPAWRQAFPIDVAQDHYVARRDFTKFVLLPSLAFVVGQFWIAVQSWLRGGRDKPAAQAVAALDRANYSLPHVPIGGLVLFSYPGEDDRCVLVRPSEAELLAYDQKCTHLSCAVAPDLEKGRLNCPCHHGVFDLTTGRPLAGPPRRPLPRIALEVRENIVYATGVELRTV